MLKLEKIKFSYGDLEVLKGISLDVSKGDFLGILGPNGSGKTTLLKLMSGLLTPDDGDIFFLEKRVEDYKVKERAKRIAVLPQHLDVPFGFSVEEIVLMGRSPYLSSFSFGGRRDLEIARETMAATDVIEFSKRRFYELSGGEQQRVMLARALAQEPELLLLDEPTAFLDIKHQVMICRLIADLNAKKEITVISIQHDINLAAIFCKRIVMLKDGMVAADGKPLDVITYANIKNVFDAQTYVGVNEFTGVPYYVPYV